MRFGRVRGTARRGPAWFDRLTMHGRAVGLAALAAGVVLALAAMPGCGAGCPTPEQAAYLEEVKDWSDRAESATRDFAGIIKEPERRPETLLEEGWRRRLKRAMDDMNSANEEIIGVDPPAGAEDVHRALVRVAEATSESSELLWQGVLAVDVELLGRALERSLESNRLLFEELLPAAENFCK